MPYAIVYRKGDKRPYKIVNLDTSQTVGTSTSRKDAEESIRARYMGEHKK